MSYAKIDVVARWSGASGYWPQSPESYQWVLSSPTKRVLFEGTAGTSGQTVDLSGFATNCDSLLIINSGTSNTVHAKFVQQLATKTFGAGTITFNDANPDTIVDSGATFVSALYLENGDRVTVSGATTGGNNGTFLVQTVAAGTLTLAASEAITGGGADAGTPAISAERTCRTVIQPASAILVQRPVISADLVLTGISSSSTVRVVAFGT